MNTYSFQEFIKHEIEAVQKNIGRLNAGIQHYGQEDPRTPGILFVLHEREEQLKFLEQMQKQAHTYDKAMEMVRQKLARSEAAHQKAVNRDLQTNQLHSAEWWDTLHQIEYLGEFIRRIHTWQTEVSR